jgi:hypothetical protein
MSRELDYLFEISSQNPPCIVELPGASDTKRNNTYNVNLETRKIQSPEFLSVSTDHKAEVVYFVVDRFFDYMDLTTTTCVIQYIAPGNVPYVYIVPYYDIYTLRNHNKIIIPWEIDGSATQCKGTIQYSIRFFKIDGSGESAKLVYNLNTLPAESKILDGLNIDPLNKDAIDFETQAYEQLMQHISDLYKNQGTYWEIVD